MNNNSYNIIFYNNNNNNNEGIYMFVFFKVTNIGKP